jgi:enoyl-CoA hydratase/carnithine racemase
MNLIEELSDALGELEADKDVRVVVLTDVGTAFSSGYDLSEQIGESDGPPTAGEWIDHLGKQPRRVYTI